MGLIPPRQNAVVYLHEGIGHWIIWSPGRSPHPWRMFASIDRVYVNAAARRDLGWQPQYDFAHVLNRLRESESIMSPLARLVGSKGYHEQSFKDGPYPIE